MFLTIGGHDGSIDVVIIVFLVLHFNTDTATVYKNEEDIGHALKELLPKHGLSRSDIFITSKLGEQKHGLNIGNILCFVVFSFLFSESITNYISLMIVNE